MRLLKQLSYNSEIKIGLTFYHLNRLICKVQPGKNVNNTGNKFLCNSLL